MFSSGRCWVFSHLHNMVFSLESKVTISGLKSSTFLGRNIKYLCSDLWEVCCHLDSSLLIWNEHPSPVAGNEDMHALRKLPSLAAALQTESPTQEKDTSTSPPSHMASAVTGLKDNVFYCICPLCECQSLHARGVTHRHGPL